MVFLGKMTTGSYCICKTLSHCFFAMAIWKKISSASVQRAASAAYCAQVMSCLWQSTKRSVFDMHNKHIRPLLWCWMVQLAQGKMAVAQHAVMDVLARRLCLKLLRQGTYWQCSLVMLTL